MKTKKNLYSNHKNNKVVNKQTRNNIELLYSSLKLNIANRNQVQEKQKRLWDLIKSTHKNYRNEMQKIDNQIGSSTHNINMLISNLCEYKTTHKAMNLANDYLSKEIDRINKIISYREGLIRDVRNGRITLITSEGKNTTDVSASKNYVELKKNQLKKLVAWKSYVSRYARAL